ncbi:MAG: flagellar hook-basal body complex protein [Rhodospirillales bacterium]|nr:flagellar hook-basal body complex protein [Rhodospirillales bacterium]
MVGYSLFQTSTLGMRSNTHALNTIGSNIANVNTGGFKRTDTRFETVLSQTLDKNMSDLGGVRPKDYYTMSQQGNITSSTRDLDLAIVGTGFFQLSNSLTDFNDENLFYTRDGSFQIVTTEDTDVLLDANGNSEVDASGAPIEVNHGYLADKNGYFLLGWVPETDGTFLETGTPAPMRIDSYAFATNFQETTLASLNLNLPSTAQITTDHAATVLAALSGSQSDDLETYTIDVVDSNGAKRAATLNFTKSATNQWEVSATTSRASTPQIDTLILQGTVEAGDTYSVTVNNSTVSYTTTGLEADMAAVRTALITAINADAVVGNRVTATAGVASGEINLTENVGTTTAQIDTITIAGSVEAGDQYTVSVDGITVTYTVTGAEANLGEIRDGLLAAISANTAASAVATAAAGTGAGEITLTAVTSGTAFTSTATANVTGATVDNSGSRTTTLENDDGTSLTTTATAANAGAVAQVDTVTLAGTVEAGDQYTATINGTTVTYTVTGGEVDIDAVRDALVTAINADSGVNAIAVAAAGAGTGEFTLTAIAAGNTLTTSVAAPTTGATVDNTATLVNTTAAVAVVNDNNVVAASNTNYQTTATQTLDFTALGELVGPAPVTRAFALAFDDGATVNVDIDMSNFTQYGNTFLPTNYESNGQAIATLGRVTFDSSGVVLGNFDDGTQRAIYKLPLTNFTNPNGLDMLNGMVFQTSADSGAPETFAADTSGLAAFTPYSLEKSNVDITDEFAKMIMVQNAYNSNATVFKTVDEMTMVARDLKA